MDRFTQALSRGDPQTLRRIGRRGHDVDDGPSRLENVRDHARPFSRQWGWN